MNELDIKTTRQDIRKVENLIRETPGSMIGDCFPLKHSFADGLYIREIQVPKGFLIVTKLFKQNHVTFLLKGECSVLTENGVQRIKAPYSMVTDIGTKRVIYTHEDVIWTTVHSNKSNIQDVDLLEEEIISKESQELSKDEVNFIDIISKEVEI